MFFSSSSQHFKLRIHLVLMKRYSKSKIKFRKRRESSSLIVRVVVSLCIHGWRKVDGKVQSAVLLEEIICSPV